jgi:hypothetical protein
MKRTACLLAMTLVSYSCSTPTERQAPALDEKKELEAIMQTIRSETDCFFKRDYACWKDNFIQRDYAFQAWSNPDGTFDAKQSWKKVDEQVGKYIRENKVLGTEHNSVERRNLVHKFYGDNAVFLVWDQYNSTPSGKKYYHSKEVRVMEKENGKWKIVNVSAFWDYKNLVPSDSLALL